MAKKVTYAAIYKIDPAKFSDLESTMRMLYDHGDKPADENSSPTVSIVSSAPAVSPRQQQTSSPKEKATKTTGQLPAKRKAKAAAAASPQNQSDSVAASPAIVQ